MILKLNFKPIKNCNSCIEVRESSESNIVLKCFSDFIKDYWNDEYKGPANSKSLRKTFLNEFPRSQQHDAREFILAFFKAIQLEKNPTNEHFNLYECESLNEALEQFQERSNSVIDEFFIGIYETIFRCKSCKKKKRVYEEFNYVSLYPSAVSHSKHAFINFLARSKTSTLSKIKCQNCGNSSECDVQTSIAKYPKYLIFAIERADPMHLYKITDFCDYPGEFIQSSPIGSKKIKYELNSTISHSGSLHSGHYTAVSKRKDGWKYFNDHMVFNLPETRLKTGKETVLIYKTDSN